MYLISGCTAFFAVNDAHARIFPPTCFWSLLGLQDALWKAMPKPAKEGARAKRILAGILGVGVVAEIP